MSTAKYYVDFETMRSVVHEKSKKGSLEEVLWHLARAKENSRFASKMDERKALKVVDADTRLLFPLKASVNTNEKKAFLLLQTSFLGIPLEMWELKKQSIEI